MLKIQRNSTVAIWATFSEKMQDPANNWVLLKLKNDANPDMVFETLLINNISTFLPRIDKYNITETVDPQDLPQHISLPLNGFYEYQAYEVEPPTNYAVPGYVDLGYWLSSDAITLELIEIGRCLVEGEFVNIHPVYL